MINKFSIAKRLYFGFGVLLLLMFFISVISFNGVREVRSRNERGQLADHLESLALTSGIARRDFIITESAINAEKAKAGIQEVAKLVQEKIGVFTDKENIAALNRLKDISAEYIATLDTLKQSAEKKRALIDGWEKDRDAAHHGIDQLADMDSQAASALQVNTLKLDRDFLELNAAVANLLANKSSEQVVQASATTVANTLAALNNQLDAQQKSIAQQISAALTGYVDKVKQIDELRVDISVNHDNIQGMAKEILAKTNFIAANQQKKIQAETNQLMMLVIGSALLAAVLSVVVAVVISRSIIHPLQKLMAVTSRIGDGDLSVQIDARGRDEIGILSQSMQKMKESLADVLSRVSSTAAQLATSAEELSAVTEQNSAAANSQKQETEQVATAINEMAMTVQEVAQNTERSASEATEANQLANNADHDINQAMDKVNTLHAEMRSSSHAMRNVVTGADNIGRVLDVIKSVADQTNLLALNAAIEAARAGEYGRGFAVVADEVRTLALRTQTSTKEIEQLISSLQHMASDAEQSVTQNMLATVEVVDYTDKVRQSLSAINAAIARIQAMGMQISTAAEEQTLVAEDINRSVVSVRDITVQTAAATEQVAASSVNLARMGNELQTLIARFHF